MSPQWEDWLRRTFRGPGLTIGKIPDQVVRLAILFIGAGVVLLIVRSALIPESFGLTGHYRFAAIADNADRELHFAGWQTCIECHDDVGETKQASYHRSVSCEVCHGPAALHAEDFEAQTPVIPRKRGEACLYCHGYLPSRPTGFPQIIETEHNPLRPCLDCHNPHDPTPPDIPETCSACHAQIARTKAVSHHRNLECETCHQVEPEHRVNPRAALPTKPTERAFCGQCHAEGADSPANIPRIDLQSHGGTYRCWQCHYPHFPEAR